MRHDKFLSTLTVMFLMFGAVFAFASSTSFLSSVAASANASATSELAPWIDVGPRSIQGSTLQTVTGNAGAGKVNSLSISSNQSVIYAGSGAGPGNSGPYSDGGVRLTRDGGAHWTEINNGMSDHHVSAVLMDPNNTDIALTGTWFSGIYRTANGGSNWSLTSSFSTSSFLLDGTNVFAGTSSGILSSSNFGETWTTVSTTSFPVRVLVSSQDGKTLYAGLDNGEIMSSTNAGATWSNVYHFSSATMWSMAVSSSSSSTVYAVAWTGSYSSSDLWVSKDGGSSWSAISSLTDIQYVATDPLNSNILYAMGDMNSYKSTDSGTTFATLQPYSDVRELVVSSQNDNTLFIASDQGIYKSTDGGETWSSINGDMASSLFTSGSVSSDGRTFLASVQDYSPIVSFDGGSSWQISSTGVGEGDGALINPASNSYAYLFTISGFQFSNNGGQSFTQIQGVPALPTTPICAPNAIAVDRSNPSDVFIASNSGIYESTNYGQTFVLNSLSGQSLSAIGVDGNRLYAANSTAVLYSSNGGTSWSSISTSLPNVNTIAVDPSNSSIVFVGNSNGLYKSMNGGNSFTPVSGLNLGNVITPPCAGVGVAYLATVDGTPTLFVGTGAGIFESADLGNSWNNLTFNINATEVTSIDYTGGNLYVTTYGEGFLEWPIFPEAPLSPLNFVAQASSGEVTLTWSSPFNGGSPITSYLIYRGTVPTNETLLKTVLGESLSYTDTSVTPGTVYYYNVSAENAVGIGKPAVLSVSVPMPVTTISSTNSSFTTTSTTMPIPEFPNNSFAFLLTMLLVSVIFTFVRMRGRTKGSSQEKS